jgi:hypothetical protein
MPVIFEGNVSYKTEGSKVYIGINKITNKDNSRSGTLKVSLITRSFKYTGGSIFPFNYDTVAMFKLEPLSGGYCYEGVSRCLNKNHGLTRTY